MYIYIYIYVYSMCVFHCIPGHQPAEPGRGDQPIVIISIDSNSIIDNQ